MESGTVSIFLALVKKGNYFFFKLIISDREVFRNYGSHPKKMCFCLGGGGSCPNQKVSRNFFVLFMFEFFLERGVLPSSKIFEEDLCFKKF